MGMTGLRRGIENPLEYVELITRLRSNLNDRGFVFEWSTDMKAFNEVKLQAR